MDYLTANGIYQGDALELIKRVATSSIHLILSDIPYGIGIADWDVLHKNTNSAYRGASPAQQNAGGVFKARGKPINGWSQADRTIPQEYQEWCASWASEWYRVLKPGASAFIFAGRRLSHRCACAMEDAGFNLKDTIAWTKPTAPHRAQRLSVIYDKRGDHPSAEQWDGWRVGNLRPIFEPIMWFTKPYKLGGTLADNVLTHGVGGYNEVAFRQYFDKPANIVDGGLSSEETGLHPTQKPVRLMEALIVLTTQEGQLVLDPFAGSGSTLVAAQRLNRKYMGFEGDNRYIEQIKTRLVASRQEVSR